MFESKAEELGFAVGLLPEIKREYNRLADRVDELEAFVRVVKEQTVGDCAHNAPYLHDRAERILNG